MTTRLTPVRSHGFTLLELLVALAIFGLLATLSYGGLQTVMNQEAQTKIAADQLGELQKLFMLMQRDIEQVVPRSIRDEFGDERPPLVGSNVLELTRAGWRNPVGRKRSTLQRVAYAHQDEHLVRFSWQVLDRAQDTQPQVQPLTDAVEALRFRYLGEDNEWVEQWPNPLATPAPAAGANVKLLPKMVEVTIEHKTYGPIVWLFQIPL